MRVIVCFYYQIVSFESLHFMIIHFILFSVFNLSLPSSLISFSHDELQAPPHCIFCLCCWRRKSRNFACPVNHGTSVSSQTLLELPECLENTVFSLWIDRGPGVGNFHQFPQERKNGLKSQRSANETQFVCLKQKLEIVVAMYHWFPHWWHCMTCYIQRKLRIKIFPLSQDIPVSYVIVENRRHKA